jgi:O-antigen ligase
VWTRLAGLANVSIESGMAGVDEEGSAEARWQLWQIAAVTARDHPLLGVGAGMMPAVNRAQAAREKRNWSVRGARDTHSTYLRIAADTGFPGLAFYLMIWGASFWQIRKVRKQLRVVRPGDHQLLFYLELSMIAFTVASLFGTYGALNFTYLSLGVAWLAAAILEKEPWYVGQPAALAATPAVPAGRRRR